MINVYIQNNMSWYSSVGQGMGQTLLIANNKMAYTLSDRSSWISFNKKDNLKIVCENLPPLFNQYGIILVKDNLDKNLTTSLLKITKGLSFRTLSGLFPARSSYLNLLSFMSVCVTTTSWI